ncbi:MAG: selenocysteine-specific translation elongation factor [bacterium]|nr:selenocysteine-specific translation elongation factor [bacterium]
MRIIPMRNIIVGTAGHIDHGKTALVGALTGIDTDRLAEEKRRGISIELGFAHLQLSEKLRIGFVDVPGHERFIKNMLAGVSGIDLVLFVVAADESIKPQTREHFDICRLLGIGRGIVVLTKSDLVDDEILELVRLEVEEFVRGSFLEGAPVLAASAETRDGIQQVREQLAQTAVSVGVKDSSRHFRLPVDRAFSMKGFGAVVTGTLVSGSVRLEDEVEVHPGGERLRVRGVQVHGADAKRAIAGQRTALNLAGAGAAATTRGKTLTHPNLFEATTAIDTVFQLLPSAKPLKHRAPVHFHAGAAEVVAEARLLEGNDPVPPAHSAFVRFLLREPVLLLPRDRFIVRMFSPVITIGGGTVLDSAPPRRVHRASAGERLEILNKGSIEDRIALLVEEAPYGANVEALVRRTGLLAPEIETAAQSSRIVFLEQPSSWLANREAFNGFVGSVRKSLAAYHRSNPLQPGMGKEDLRAAVLPDAPSFLLDAVLGAASDIVAEADTVRLASHRLRFNADEEQALGKIESAFERAGLKAPATAEVLASSGVEPARARNLLQILLRQNKLVRVGDQMVFHASAIAQLRGLLASHKGEQFGVPQFKDWTGISRKYAIPLLEYLDRERVTRRDGDNRVVL